MTEEQLQEGPFNKGEAVKEEGNYVCVPCGFHKHFAPGETFGECTSCLSGTADGHEEFAEGLEMWEKEMLPPTEGDGGEATE